MLDACSPTQSNLRRSIAGKAIPFMALLLCPSSPGCQQQQQQLVWQTDDDLGLSSLFFPLIIALACNLWILFQIGGKRHALGRAAPYCWTTSALVVQSCTPNAAGCYFGESSPSGSRQVLASPEMECDTLMRDLESAQPCGTNRVLLPCSPQLQHFIAQPIGIVLCSSYIRD